MNAWLCPTTARAEDLMGDGLGSFTSTLAKIIKAKKGKRKPATPMVFGVPISQHTMIGPAGERLPAQENERYQYLLRLRDAGWAYTPGRGWHGAQDDSTPTPPASAIGTGLLPPTPLPSVGPTQPPAPPIATKDLTTLLVVGLIGIGAVAYFTRKR
mgnify:CR=1 FL=1